jgi:hypothetical protein
LLAGAVLASSGLSAQVVRAQLVTGGGWPPPGPPGVAPSAADEMQAREKAAAAQAKYDALLKPGGAATPTAVASPAPHAPG